MSDYKNQLENIKEKMDQQKVDKAKFEERLESVLKEIKKLDEDMTELDVTKDNIDEKMETLEKEIQSDLENCEKVLNNE